MSSTKQGVKRNFEVIDVDDDDADFPEPECKMLKTEDLPAQTIAVEPSLSEEQKRVVDVALNGQNIFITGSAGTGKSVLLRQLIRALHARDKRVAVMAPTGVAAEAIGGTTVHAFFGCGVPNRLDDFGKMWGKKSVKNIRKTDVVVIDEVSMLSGEMFDCIEKQVALIRREGSSSDLLPFGGIQLVLSGDFFQLPPVHKALNWTQNTEDSTKPKDKLKDILFFNRGFAFQASAWKNCKIQTYQLSKVFRQADMRFVSILNSLRIGDITTEAKAALQACRRELSQADGIKATELHCKNVDVDRINQQELAKIRQHEMTYEAHDTILVENDTDRNVTLLKTHPFWKQCRASATVGLKVGAQVMLLKNLDLTNGPANYLVNGSRGVITSFVPIEAALKKLEEETVENNTADAIRQQKWSRVKQFQSGKVSESNHDLIMGSAVKQPVEVLPVVKFANGREEIIMPEAFDAKIESAGSCLRLQIPLMLAWAITIHKAQGMSLDRVFVNVREAFADGQVYVALSRARSLEGLRVIGFSAQLVQVNALAKQFYRDANTVFPHWNPKHDKLAAMASIPDPYDYVDEPISESSHEPMTTMRTPSPWSSLTESRFNSTIPTPNPSTKASAKLTAGQTTLSSFFMAASRLAKHSDTAQPVSSSSTLFSSSVNTQSTQQQNQTSYSKQTSSHDDRHCFQCGQSDHWVAACPQRKPQNGFNSAAAGGGIGSAVGGSSTTHMNRSRDISASCFKCGQVGHYAKSCPKSAFNGFQAGSSSDSALESTPAPLSSLASNSQGRTLGLSRHPTRVPITSQGNTHALRSTCDRCGSLNHWTKACPTAGIKTSTGYYAAHR